MTFVEFHDEAMKIVDEARAAERAGDFEQRTTLLRSAYKLEQEAARLLNPVPESEPTRSVLFRSASSLAFQAEDYEEARDLALDGLSRNGPAEYTTELLDLANDAKFRLKLISQKLRVIKAEIALILRGPGVSVGLAPAKQATLILRRIERLLRSHIERSLKAEAVFRGMRRPATLSKLYKVFMRPLGSEEFAVAFRFGLPEQLDLFRAAPIGDELIANFMKDLQAAVYGGVAPGANEQFAQEIFKLEPDGKDVTSIEMSTRVAGELVSVRIPPKKGPAKATPGKEALPKPAAG